MSCGYHIERLRKSLPDGSRAVYIEPFRNATATARVENFFTDAIKKEFYSNGGIKLVSPGNAGVILRGTVESINLTGTAFKKNINENLEAREYLLTISVSVSLYNSARGKIWSGNFKDQEIFNVFDNIMKSESERLKAARRISKNMMRKVYDSIFSSFSNES